MHHGIDRVTDGENITRGNRGETVIKKESGRKQEARQDEENGTNTERESEIGRRQEGGQGKVKAGQARGRQGRTRLMGVCGEMQTDMAYKVRARGDMGSNDEVRGDAGGEGKRGRDERKNDRRKKKGMKRGADNTQERRRRRRRKTAV